MTTRKTSRATRSVRSVRSASTAPRSRKTHARKPAGGAGRGGRAGRSRARGTTTKSQGNGLTWGEKGSGSEVPMHTVTPNILPTDCAAALDWYTKVFGAKELARMPGPKGLIMHAMTQIGDTVVMMSDNFGPPTQPEATACAFLHVHDKAIQRFWDRAVEGGATVVMPLANQFWGDKYGQLRDPYGITWSFGWPAKMTEAEKESLQREAMQQMSAQVDA